MRFSWVLINGRRSWMIKHSKCARLEDDRTRHLCSHYLYPRLPTLYVKSSKKSQEIRVIQDCEAARAGKKKEIEKENPVFLINFSVVEFARKGHATAKKPLNIALNPSLPRRSSYIIDLIFMRDFRLAENIAIKAQPLNNFSIFSMSTNLFEIMWSIWYSVCF